MNSASMGSGNLPRLKGRVLVVEDNITNQQVALGILRKLGAHADAVADGAEALTSLQIIPYDLVLMDIQMPVMDGLTATRQIRAFGSPVQNRHVPIVAMTAHATEGHRTKCLDAGMNDFISKPITPRGLVQVLQKWLPAAGTDMPVFDRRALLDRLMGDGDLARTIVAGFLEDIPRQIQALKGFLAADDIHGAERQAHAIKGAAANVSAERLQATALEMEEAGQDDKLAAIAARMAELETRFDQANVAMKPLLQHTDER